MRDIDFERGLVFMRRAFSENVLQDRPKDDDERVIPIAELARAQLEEAARRLKPEDFLVTNRNGKTRTRQAVWLAFNAVQIKAGLDRRFGVVLAGHEDPRTTQRYLHAERSGLGQRDGDVRDDLAASPVTSLRLGNGRGNDRRAK